MKRSSIEASDDGGGVVQFVPEERCKRPRSGGEEGEAAGPVEEEVVAMAELGEDLVLEVLRRSDARTLGRAACVSRRWRKMAEDEGVWETVCTRDWVKVPCAQQQLRSVVLALGGFRRLHSLYILPFLTPSARRPSPVRSLPAAAAASPSTMTRRAVPPPQWGKDAVQLSLSLFSIGFFEKMNRNNNNRRSGGG